MNRKPRNVLPLVNKALAIFQWKQDMPQAEKLCNEALAIDPDCDVAVATLAQLSLQQGKLEEAIKWFEKSGKLARTEGELANAITCTFGVSYELYGYTDMIRRTCFQGSVHFLEGMSCLMSVWINKSLG